MSNTFYTSAILILFIYFGHFANAQINQNKLGSWSMYNVNGNFNNGPFGFQGDTQLRIHQLITDLEQYLFRGAFTYSPESSNIKFGLGYGSITTGTYGEETATTTENRIFQEAVYRVKFGERVYAKNRFRYEQRFMENQNFRTRYRYNLSLKIPLNSTEIRENTLYLSVFNEIFINGQREIGDEMEVEIFDRNRTYTAFGYVLSEHVKMQVGLMRQITDNWTKNQLMASLYHTL